MKTLPHFRVHHQLLLAFSIPVFLFSVAIMIEKMSIQAQEEVPPAPVEQVISPPKIVPQQIEDSALPPIHTAKSLIIIDDDDNILFAANEHQRLPQASLTKLMTALVAVESYPLTDVITIGQEPQVVGNKIHVQTGQQFTVRELLKGLLIFSGNDAAAALANHYPYGYDSFIAAMNGKAVSLGLKDTNFTNPAGLDHPEHYSSAYDVAQLLKMASGQPLLQETMTTPFAVVENINKTVRLPLYTTNQLLYQLDGVTGGKTGSTENAGECLAVAVSRNDRTLYAVVLGSEHRFEEMKSMIEWAFANHEWVEERSLSTFHPNDIE